MTNRAFPEVATKVATDLISEHNWTNATTWMEVSKTIDSVLIASYVIKSQIRDEVLRILNSDKHAE